MGRFCESHRCAFEPAKEGVFRLSVDGTSRAAQSATLSSPRMVEEAPRGWAGTSLFRLLFLFLLRFRLLLLRLLFLFLLRLLRSSAGGFIGLAAGGFFVEGLGFGDAAESRPESAAGCVQRAPLRVSAAVFRRDTVVIEESRPGR